MTAEKYVDVRPAEDCGPYQNTFISSPEEVREKFQQVKRLKDVPQRGWVLDVLNIVRRITNQSREFSSPSPHPSPPGEGKALGRRKYSFAADTHSDAGSKGGIFTNDDVYAYERELEKLHPDNRHIRDKIRQQLQVLRDTGFLTQPERGVWRGK